MIILFCVIVAAILFAKVITNKTFWGLVFASILVLWMVNNVDMDYLGPALAAFVVGGLVFVIIKRVAKSKATITREVDR